MAKRRISSKQTPQLKKNFFLFILSISILAGATWLFLSIIELPGLPFKVNELINPAQIISAIKAKLVKKEIDDRHIAKKSGKEEADASISLGNFDYSFYDILSHQKKTAMSGTMYAIQIESFKTRHLAQEFKEHLEKEKRLTCRISKRGNHYAVLWSGFPTRSSAERYSRQLSLVLDRECKVIEM